MNNQFLSFLPWLAGGGFSLGDANPLYVLITTILTAIIEYLKWRNQKKKEQKSN